MLQDLAKLRQSRRWSTAMNDTAGIQRWMKQPGDESLRAGECSRRHSLTGNLQEQDVLNVVVYGNSDIVLDRLGGGGMVWCDGRWCCVV